MKRRYQMDREQAVRRFERQAGIELMQLIMEDEVRQLAGERC